MVEKVPNDASVGKDSKFSYFKKILDKLREIWEDRIEFVRVLCEMLRKISRIDRCEESLQTFSGKLMKFREN